MCICVCTYDNVLKGSNMTKILRYFLQKWKLVSFLELPVITVFKYSRIHTR
jgi:hypothetical protein